MKDIELPPLPTPSWPFGCKYNEKDMQAYARAAVEADRAQRVPDGYREVLSNLLWAATERDAKNRIRQFDEFLDAARSMLASTPAQPAQQEPQRKLSAVDLAKAAAKEKFRHYREVMVNAHQEPPAAVERKPMTDEVVREGFAACGVGGINARLGFVEGVKFTERHHGIRE